MEVWSALVDSGSAFGGEQLTVWLYIHAAISQVKTLRLGTVSKVIRRVGFRNLTSWLWSLTLPDCVVAPHLYSVSGLAGETVHTGKHRRLPGVFLLCLESLSCEARYWTAKALISSDTVYVVCTVH